MKHVLITGGAGFLGSNLAKYIKERNTNIEISIVDDLSAGKLEFVCNDKIKYCDKFICDDFSSKQIIDNLNTKGYDVVYHLAAIPRVGYSVDFPSISNNINVQKTVILLQASINNIDRFINISSSAIYGDVVNGSDNDDNFEPKSPYGLQKLITEKYCKLFSKLYNLDTVSIRPFNIYGPNQLGNSAYSTVVSSWFHSAKRGLQFRLHGDGSKTRDMIYVDDVCEIIYKASIIPEKQMGTTYNAGTGMPIKIFSILEWFSKTFPHVNIIQEENRLGDPQNTCANMVKTRNNLNFNKNYNFWDALENTKKWCFESKLF